MMTSIQTANSSPLQSREETLKQKRESDGARFRRALWFWHFWIGILIAPSFFVVSVTGLIYVFKPELELWWYADIAAAENSTVSDYWLKEEHAEAFQKGIDRVTAGVEEGWRPIGLELENGSGRLPALLFRSEERREGVLRLYFDPAEPKRVAAIPEPNLFTLSLDLHRRLMAGTLGRVLVELTTGWGIVTSLLGVAIWWPKSWKRLRGVFVPRLDGKPYVVWRDLHAIGGLLLGGLLVLIAGTGLLYSVAWGSLYHGVAFARGEYDLLLDPPKSEVSKGNNLAEEPKRISSINALHLGVQQGVPTERISIHFPHDSEGAYAIEGGGWWGPSVSSMVHIDAYSGEVLKVTRLKELGWMAQWTQWNYPLHVGSIGGVFTKIFWLFASCLFAFLPISGIVMCWLRKKPGVSVVPRYYEGLGNGAMLYFQIAIGIALPLVGISMLVILALRSALYSPTANRG